MCSISDTFELPVPYSTQINDNACAAAALEMVCRYHGEREFSQLEVLSEWQEPEPHGSGEFRISTDNLVRAAQSLHYQAGWGRVSIEEPRRAFEQLAFFLNVERIPIIACQSYLEDQAQIGHSRVIIGLRQEQVVFHDPCPYTGGPFQRWTLAKFIEHWRPTGENVTGGVVVWISRSRPALNILRLG